MTVLPPTPIDIDPTPRNATLPDTVAVYSPFPLSTYPGDVAALDEQAVSWCLRHRLFDPGSTSTRMGCAYGIAHALPFAHETTVLAASRHFYWGSAFDDYCDHHPDLPGLAAEVGELQRVMYAAPSPGPATGNRWIVSLRALRDDIESVLTDEEFAVFGQAHTVWLSGQLWYTALQQRPGPPSVGEWLRMRWAKVGVATLVPFTAASSGVEALTARHARDRTVRAYTEAVMTGCALLNDIASSAKEVAAGTGNTNLLAVLAPPGTDTVDPIAAVELYERVVSVAHRLQRQLLADPRPDVARYARELPRWIPAGIEWASTTVRYLEPAGPGAPGFSPPQISVSTVPTVWDPDDLTPPPYPEIAWWWKELR
ncbi:terpene synthase family protein [Nocardia sp. NPDC003963]